MEHLGELFVERFQVASFRFFGFPFAVFLCELRLGRFSPAAGSCAGTLPAQGGVEPLLKLLFECRRVAVRVQAAQVQRHTRLPRGCFRHGSQEIELGEVRFLLVVVGLFLCRRFGEVPHHLAHGFDLFLGQAAAVPDEAARPVPEHLGKGVPTTVGELVGFQGRGAMEDQVVIQPVQFIDERHQLHAAGLK